MLPERLRGGDADLCQEGPDSWSESGDAWCRSARDPGRDEEWDSLSSSSRRRVGEWDFEGDFFGCLSLDRLLERLLSLDLERRPPGIL